MKTVALQPLEYRPLPRFLRNPTTVVASIKLAPYAHGSRKELWTREESEKLAQ